MSVSPGKLSLTKTSTGPLPTPSSTMRPSQAEHGPSRGAHTADRTIMVKLRAPTIRTDLCWHPSPTCRHGQGTHFPSTKPQHHCQPSLMRSAINTMKADAGDSAANTGTCAISATATTHKWTARTTRQRWDPIRAALPTGPPLVVLPLHRDPTIKPRYSVTGYLRTFDKCSL